MFGKPQLRVQKFTKLERTVDVEEQYRTLELLDESAVLMGQAIDFSIVNGTPYPRWYQVVITNLYPTEYSLYSDSFGMVDADTLIMLNANDSCNLTLRLESDLERPRTAPCAFEVIVMEYLVPDTEVQGNIYFYKEYQLLPPVNPQSIKVNAYPKVVLVRPWHRGVRLNVSISNRSYLSLSARLRLNLLDSKGKLVPMDDEEPLLDLGRLEGLQEQHVTCLLPLDQKPQQPLQLQPVVEATVLRTGERIQRTTERSVQVNFVPFLKIWWPDWLIGGVILALLIGILFGFPPLYRPEARIRLHFESLHEGQLPAGLDPRDLKVTVEVTDARGIKFPYICLYRPYTERGVNGIEFYKRWGWQKRGLRFLWTPQPLSLKIEPDPRRDRTGQVSAKLKSYNLQNIQVDPNWAVDPAEPGVIPPMVVVSIPRKERLEVTVRLPSSWPKTDAEVAIEARINGVPSKGGPKRISLDAGRPTQSALSFDLTGQVEKGSNALVEVVGKSEPSNYVSKGSVRVSPGSPPTPVPMSPPRPSRPGFTLSVISDPPGARLYLDGQEVGITPFEENREMPAGKNLITILLKQESYKDYLVQKPVQPGGRVVVNAKLVRLPHPSAHPVHSASPVKPSVDTKPLEHWLALVGLSEATRRFRGGDLLVDIDVTQQKEQEVIIVVSANKPCWVQVYQCDALNEKREPLWGWDSFRDRIMLYPKRHDPPQNEVFRQLVRKDSALKILLTLESKSLEFVAVATTQPPPGIEVSRGRIIQDSLGWLASAPEGGHWAIDGWPPPASQ